VAADWQQLLGSSFVSFLLSFMLMKAWLPFAPKRPGEKLLDVPLGMLQRLLVHRTQAILLLLYIIIGSLPMYEGRWFIPGTQVIAMFAIFGIFMLPLRYVFTDYGVALNNGVPRPYKQFQKFDPRRDVRQGRGWLAGNATIYLRGRRVQSRSAPSFTLYVPTGSVPAVTRLLRRVIR
jgi:hypothetical protein